MYDLLNSSSDGILSLQLLNRMEEIIRLETVITSQTYKIFALLKREVTRSQRICKTREFIANLFYSALSAFKQTHYFEHPSNFIHAINELAPEILSTIRLDHAEYALSILFFAGCYYGEEYNTSYSHIFSGLLTQSLSKVAVNATMRNPSKQAYWLTGLGLGIAIDYMSESNGALVACYIGGTLLQGLSDYIFDFIKARRSPQTPFSYPKSEIFLKKLVGDLAFCGGSLVGKHVHNRFYKPMPTIVLLSDKEKDTLSSQCQLKDPFAENPFKARTNDQIDKCRTIAFKILKINPIIHNNKSPKEQKAAIRASYIELSLFWHPDKVAAGTIDPVLAGEQMTLLNLANEALKIKKTH
ncbi:hypothetical protein AYO45_00090 [Gammaproteobacteria bacterium SCGC AG-212-F23]|nr:hypothetical protein AYO45_00090 [Gammaproteobacteria bacterium SCGC AG-212-F23]